MIELKTKYLGLQLNNPLIVSSSGLTNTVEKIKRIEEYGGAAVVLKSLFEEQINAEADILLRYNEYPEASDYISGYSKNNSVSEYLKLIENSKKEVKIPVFASINCISTNDWVTFAKQIESSGADAIELNIHIVPTDRTIVSSELEERYFEIVSTVSGLVNIPIAVKIGSYFSNLVHFTDQLYANGAKGVVIFNRFYEPDIDIENLKMTSADVFSSPTDIRHSLRWVGILAAKAKQIDISASTGVHDAEAVIKQLLAGADTVQICSVLYKKGIQHIKVILDELQNWIYSKGFDSVEAMRGKMSYLSIKNPEVYERVQFMKYFSSIE